MKTSSALTSLALGLSLALLGCSEPSAGCFPGVAVHFAPSDTTIHVGESYGASLQVSDFGCGHPSDRVTWQSSNPFVATVDSTGRVTGIAPGQATISATGQTLGPVGSTLVTVAA